MAAKKTRSTSKNKVGIKAVAQHSPLQRLRHFGAELLRHEVLGAIAKTLAVIFLNPALFVAWGLAGYSYWESGVQKAAPYMAQHPWRAFFTVLLLLFAAPYINGGVKGLVKTAWRRLVALFSPHDSVSIIATTVAPNSSTDLAKVTGFVSFSPHLTKKDKKTDWMECKGYFKDAKDLRIMGATGWDTFGSPDSHLYKSLADFKGDIKIMLLCADANVAAVLDRANETRSDVQKYVDEINRTLKRLSELKKENSKRKIEVRLYSQTPVWKMIICNSYMWLQHYWPDRNVEDSPVYTLFNDGDENPTSLFHPLYSEWQKQWSLASPYSL